MVSKRPSGLGKKGDSKKAKLNSSAADIAIVEESVKVSSVSVSDTSTFLPNPNDQTMTIEINEADATDETTELKTMFEAALAKLGIYYFYIFISMPFLKCIYLNRRRKC